MLNKNFKLSLTCMAVFATSMSAAFANEDVVPDNTYNFSNTSPITVDDLPAQYAFPVFVEPVSAPEVRPEARPEVSPELIPISGPIAANIGTYYTDPYQTGAYYTAPNYPASNYPAPYQAAPYQTGEFPVSAVDGYEEEAPLPAAPQVNAFAPRRAAYEPYRYIRADVALMFKKHEEIDALGQYVEFDKSKASIGLRAGVMLRRHFGIEGRLGFGLGSETKTIGAATSTYKTNGYLGALGRAQTDLGNGIVPYVNLGLMAVRTSFNSHTTPGLKETNEISVGLAGALGVEVNLRNNLVFGLEAAYLPTSIKTVAATVGYNF